VLRSIILNLKWHKSSMNEKIILNLCIFFCVCFENASLEIMILWWYSGWWRWCEEIICISIPTIIRGPFLSFNELLFMSIRLDYVSISLRIDWLFLLGQIQFILRLKVKSYNLSKVRGVFRSLYPSVFWILTVIRRFFILIFWEKSKIY
jgi:hypothetical protein